MKDELKGGVGGDDGRTKGRRVEVKGERKKQEIVWLTKRVIFSFLDHILNWFELLTPDGRVRQYINSWVVH